MKIKGNNKSDTHGHFSLKIKIVEPKAALDMIYEHSCKPEGEVKTLNYIN